MSAEAIAKAVCITLFLLFAYFMIGSYTPCNPTLTRTYRNIKDISHFDTYDTNYDDYMRFMVNYTKKNGFPKTKLRINLNERTVNDYYHKEKYAKSKNNVMHTAFAIASADILIIL